MTEIRKEINKISLTFHKYGLSSNNVYNAVKKAKYLNKNDKLKLLALNASGSGLDFLGYLYSIKE